ncbi:MAG: hypothetical protein ACRDJV_04540 [Actinomycetota bacterium]
MRDESTKRGIRLRRHVRSNLVGYLALAVSLSLAPAYASHLIVRTSDIKNGAVTTPKLANRAVTAKKLARQPDFIGATLEPGFTNLGGGYRPAGFMKDTLGFVHLRGVMDCPAGENTAFVLPSKLRPAEIEAGPMGIGGQAGGNLQVLPDGQVRPFLPSGAGACVIPGSHLRQTPRPRPHLGEHPRRVAHPRLTHGRPEG